MGMIFALERFSVSDGPGIRTTVFFKGCPLKCVWCHNPESQSHTPELSYHENLCVMCGGCAGVCPRSCHDLKEATHVFERSFCGRCFKCAGSCFFGALKTVGEEKSADEIMKEVIKDREYYNNSGGGLTLSGGEPFAQPGFLLELLKTAKKEGLHTCVETSGFCGRGILDSARGLVDVYLFDIKETDPLLHKKFTGFDNELILNNLRLLDEWGEQIIIRCPVIPNHNDRDGHFRQIAYIASSLKNVREINVLPYHPFGGGKSVQVGAEYTVKEQPPSEELVSKWILSIKEHAVCPVKLG